MRLLNSETLKLHSFEDEGKIPPYAILSHTWGDDELAYEEVTGHRLSRPDKSLGVWKVLMCAKQARQDGLKYFWVDTCCIQKSSSVELSEAINSMFRWYKQSAVCYAFLNDVPTPTNSTIWRNDASTDEWLQKFSNSRWFTRGWTLQELIAPRHLTFFSKVWHPIGTKRNLIGILSKITAIPNDTLRTGDTFGESISCRMSWASKRQTTRIEDMAYCLLGIFDINLPLLYGEGERAFQRLQEEIMKICDDQTIFAWVAQTSTFATWRSLLAHSPSEFAQSRNFVPTRYSRTHAKAHEHSSTVTNKGLTLFCPLIERSVVDEECKSDTEFIAILGCSSYGVGRSLLDGHVPVGIFLIKIDADEYIRVDANRLNLKLKASEYFSLLASSSKASVTVRQRLEYAPWYSLSGCSRIRGIWIKNKIPSAILEEVRPKEQWDWETMIFLFNEQDMECGQLQVMHCTFSLSKGTKYLIELHFDPRARDLQVQPHYEKGSRPVCIESHLRVIGAEATLVVEL